MRNDYGCEISDSLARDSREYAVNAVRAFGQSIRSFSKLTRLVIVVDESFLKSKFKGLTSGTPIYGKGVVIFKYPYDPTVALVYLSAAFLLACIVAGTQAFEVMYSVLFNIKLILLIMWDLLLSPMDETTFKRGEANLDQAAGTVDKKQTEENIVQTLFEVGENVEIASGRKWYPGNVLKKDIRNGVEMVQVEYSTLFQDKNKKIKRLQESVYSDRIRPQPPSEKPEETKSLELMDNVEAYHNDGWCNARREPLDGSHTSPLSQQVETQDMNMMRDSIPELLALPELKYPIGSEPKLKEPLDGSHASPLSQQVETQVYSPNSTQHVEKEPSNQAHAAQTQFFSTNVTQQEPLNESHLHLHCLNRLKLRFILLTRHNTYVLKIEKEQLNEAPDVHTRKEIEPSLDEMPSNPIQEKKTLTIRLQKIVIEDFGFEETNADLELSYLPIGLINSSECPPVIIGNSQQVQSFLGFCKKHQSTRLCVSSKAKQGNPNKVDIDLKLPTDASKHNEKKKWKMKQGEVDGDDYNADKHNEKKKGKMKQDEVDGDEYDANNINSEKENKEKLAKSPLVELVKIGDLFLNKTVLKARCSFGGVRAECLNGSTYIITKKYIGEHSCAPSSKTSAGKTASAKMICGLIMHKYEARDSREYAVNAVRGIPQESYGIIQKCLHMLQEANPVNSKGCYWLQLLYMEIQIQIQDSENDKSWEWFMRKLKVVVDDNGLAFISDRQRSIAKALENVYPLARHGICIHHLLNNVVSQFKGRGLSGLISKASKAYSVADFKKTFAHVCNISPEIGNYLIDADVKKWARCQFLGYKYDIRTKSPAESINYALHSMREFPVIHLLDSIREMLTCLFFKRKKLILKYTHPLTIDVEEKIDGRIEKGKTFVVYLVNDCQLLVKGDTIECFVDLDKWTCSCGKYDLLKIPCRHAIKAGFFVGREPHRLTDFLYTTGAWREAYQESINPIAVSSRWLICPTSATA
uniref:SWIM-type domain-containing protein n=1 Tax=Brassica oleracea var. oleracea TaxID=109376 RepID=A0A0D3ATT9_BRAOL